MPGQPSFLYSIFGRSHLRSKAKGFPMKWAETPTIEATGLTMNYGQGAVLKGIDLTLHTGEVLALLGPNGAGKTTTVEILEGFRKRSGGEVRVLGTDPDHGDEAWKARLGIVLQSWRDHRKWRVRELLAHIGRYYQVYSTTERPRPYDADELLEQVGLEEQAMRPVAKLSGGQRRRLDVAIGLVGNPEVLFLDEPTVGFDPEARSDFHALISRLTEERKTSILLTTHDLREAETLSHRIAILMNGRISAEGSAQELAARYSGSVAVSYFIRDDEYHQRLAHDEVTDYLYSLLERAGPMISGLRVEPSSLEDTYLCMVREEKSADATAELSSLEV